MRSNPWPTVLAITVVVATSLVVSSSALTVVAVDRSAPVTVTVDPRASLGIAPHAGPNGAFVTDAGDGVLALALDGDAPGVIGEGGNPEAHTHLDRVLNVTNLGTGPMAVWIVDDAPLVAFHTHDADHGSLEGRDGAVVLVPGESMQVGLSVDTRGTPAGVRLLEAVTVHAEAAE